MIRELLNCLELLVHPGEPAEIPTLRIADRFPNVELINQLNQSFAFREKFIRSGTSLVINSMYTTCRGSCPGTSATIKKLRRELYPVFKERLIFVSFTLEPEVDRPEKLAKYAQAYGAGVDQAGLCDWHFVTGTTTDIDRLRYALGFYNLNPRVDGDITQHGSSLLVGNPEKDRWSSHTAELSMRTLLESIRRTAGNTFQERYGIEG
jgi:protein SCO1